MTPDELRAFLRESDAKFEQGIRPKEGEIPDETEGTESGEQPVEGEVSDDIESSDEEESAEDTGEETTEGEGEVATPTSESAPSNGERNETGEKLQYLNENLGIDFTDPKNEELLGENYEEDTRAGETVIDLLYEAATSGGVELGKDGSISGIDQGDLMEILDKLGGKNDEVSKLYEVTVTQGGAEGNETTETFTGYNKIKEIQSKPEQKLTLRLKQQD